MDQAATPGKLVKRYGNLWPQIIAFENLLKAAHQAQKGKRFRENVLAFNYHLEENLHQLQRQLQNHTYRPGQYRSFRIYDPKPRLISAAPYRDRVVHHALCNVIVPLLERSFIRNTFANRLGYGTHRALQLFIQYSRQSRYILLCDIQQYFPSIDHEILKGMVRRRLKCTPTLWLIDLMIDSSNLQDPVLTYFPGDTLLTPIERRKGLPIGNLTSQFFANFYLNRFDHHVHEYLGVSKYLRYVDDFACFADDRPLLLDLRSAMETELAQLRLKIHPIKSQCFATREGANFVGFRVLPERVRVRNDNLCRSRHRLRKMQAEYAAGVIDLHQLVQRLQSWEAHLKYADTHRLRRSIFDQWSFSTAQIDKESSLTSQSKAAESILGEG